MIDERERLSSRSSTKPGESRASCLYEPVLATKRAPARSAPLRIPQRPQHGIVPVPLGLGQQLRDEGIEQARFRGQHERGFIDLVAERTAWVLPTFLYAIRL